MGLIATFYTVVQLVCIDQMAQIYWLSKLSNRYKSSSDEEERESNKLSPHPLRTTF